MALIFFTSVSLLPLSIDSLFIFLFSNFVIRHDIYSGEPVVYNDIRYEQACLLFNLGGLYSQLGANESRLADDVRLFIEFN